jgi:hypothetical protein
MKTRKKNKKLLSLSIICFSIFGLSILLMLLTSINIIASAIGIFFHLCGMYFASKSGYAKNRRFTSIGLDAYWNPANPYYRIHRGDNHRNKIF